MTADEWKEKLKAVMRAAAKGDEEPLNITCERLAIMDELLNPAPPEPTTAPEEDGTAQDVDEPDGEHEPIDLEDE